jgi:hypothetical protein
MYPYSSVVSNIQDKYARTPGHICIILFLTTLEYGYICLVLFVTTLEYGYICLVCY